jgi:hypothetical protein
MSYHAGIGERLAATIGVQANPEPHIKCDRCGKTKSVYKIKSYGAPAAWFLDGKPPPGWTGGITPDGYARVDYCPQCSPHTKRLNDTPEK